jgi:hypothetical protein
MTRPGPVEAAAALSAIWVRHRGEIMLAVDALAAAVADGLAGQLDDSQRERASGHAHRLAGSAGTFGFAAAGEIAAELEQALSGRFAPPPGACPALAELVAALRRELDGAPVPLITVG